LILPALKRNETLDSDRTNGESIVRLERQPTILSDILEDQAPPIYEARIVEDQGQVAVVRLLPSRLTATSPSAESNSPDINLPDTNLPDALDGPSR
jgi:hypothetical protein